MTELYGQSFENGAPALVLVALGQFAISLGMPFGNVLSMGGRERAFGMLNILVLAISITLAVSLIPSMGAAGGGTVMLASGLVLLLGQMLLGFKLLGLPNLLNLITRRSDPS